MSPWLFNVYMDGVVRVGKGLELLMPMVAGLR